MMKLRHGLGSYQPIPIIAGFLNKDGLDSLAETIQTIYKREAGSPSLVTSEMERIKNNAKLSHLIKE